MVFLIDNSSKTGQVVVERMHVEREELMRRGQVRAANAKQKIESNIN